MLLTSADLDAAFADALRRLRRTGADLPFGDPCGYHGIAMEGYFWRISLPHSRAVVIVMVSINTDWAGARWGTVAVAGHPGFPAQALVAESAHGDQRGIGITLSDRDGVVCDASEDRLNVCLGEDTRLNIRIEGAVPWRRRSLGGVGLAHLMPGLSQYWHPHLLGGRVTGEARLAGREVDLSGAEVYAEKNWGPSGFPAEWWWGQAHGFSDPDVCAAFAGGRVARGRLGFRATAVVARIGSQVLNAVHPVSPVQASLGTDSWRLRARTPRHVIEIDGDGTGSVAHSLPVPSVVARRHQPDAARQHLAGHMRLTVRRGPRVVYRGESTLAGLEYGGASMPAAAG